MTVGLVWFRSDLRLGDNPAWSAATRDHDRLTALFVIDPRLLGAAGAQRRALLFGHLTALDESLKGLGGRLRVERGDPSEVVPGVAGEIGADAVHANVDVTPYAVSRDAAVGSQVHLESHHGRTIHPVGSVTTRDGAPYRVFTPFHRMWAARPWDPWPEPGVAALASEPGDGIPAADPPMPPGEAAATERLERFLEVVDGYGTDRDRPDREGTSRLSADLHFGTISPRMIASAVGERTEGRRGFVRQLAWREFYASVLAAFPDTVNRSMRPEYDAVAWHDDPAGLAAWQEGRTGYPIVDAGMRQLRSEGWMHNRLRMITASFLVKDLLIDWRQGERWFRRLLIDADVAQNVGNWQWIAGTGADAAPYFRVFNPVTQGVRFDPNGDYVRRWVPELAALEGKAVHSPWTLAPAALKDAGVTLGVTYPAPIVDHAEARRRAIVAYEIARAGSS